MKKISVFLIFVSIAMIGIGGYLYLNSTKNQMLSAISTQIETLQKKQKTIEKEKVQYVTTATLKEDGVSLGTVSGDIYVDEVNLKSYLNLAVKLADGMGDVGKLPEMYVEGNKLYLKFDKETYYIDISESTGNSSGSGSKYNSEEVFNILLNALVKKIPEGNFSKENIKTTIIGSSYETTKYSLFLTRDDVYNIVENVLNEIDSNSKLKFIKEKINSYTSKTEMLKSIKSNLSSTYAKNEKIFTYSIYVKDNDILKHEINIVGNEINNSERDDFTINFGKAIRKADLYDYELIVKSGSTTIVNASIVGDDTLRNISIKFDGFDFEISGTSSNSNGNKNVTLNAYVQSNKSDPIVTLSYNYSEVTAGSEYSSKINIVLNDGAGKIEFDCSSKILKGKDVPSFDTSSAKKYQEGSSGGEMNEYFENFSENFLVY